MSLFIEPPPINEPFVTDASGKIRSSAWVMWLSSIADAISSASLGEIQPVQTTLIQSSSYDDFVDLTQYTLGTYDVASDSTYDPAQEPYFPHITYDAPNLSTLPEQPAIPHLTMISDSSSTVNANDDIYALFWTN